MSIAGANNIAVGFADINTNAIIASCAEPGIAARICADLTSGGYSDWYLPTIDELVFIVNNRNLIPGFVEESYWSSTQSIGSANNAYLVYSDLNYSPMTLSRNNSINCFPIRYF